MAISDEVIQLVWILDGYNRHRLAAEPNLLAGWTAARNVIGPVRAGEPTPPQAGQIEPAA